MYVMASKPKTLPYRVILEDTQAMPREVWLKHRKPAVCASDYPAIVGLCAFRTAVDIYEDKIDPENVQTEITLADKYRFDIGHALESVMHEAIAAEIGAVPVRDKRMTESTLYPYMRVDIDGLFLLQEDCVVCGHPLKKGEVVLYEGKTTGYSKFLEYRETPSPAHVAQCKFGMLVRGLSHCILGIGCGGNQLHNDLVYHVCTLTEEDRETIPLVVRTFWEENVLRRTPPTEALGFYASNFKKALIAYYGKTAAEDGKTLCLPTHTAEILKRTLVVREELSRLMAEQRAKERERDAIEAPLIVLCAVERQQLPYNRRWRRCGGAVHCSRRIYACDWEKEAIFCPAPHLHGCTPCKCPRKSAGIPQPNLEHGISQQPAGYFLHQHRNKGDFFL